MGRALVGMLLGRLRGWMCVCLNSIDKLKPHHKQMASMGPHGSPPPHKAKGRPCISSQRHRSPSICEHIQAHTYTAPQHHKRTASGGPDAGCGSGRLAAPGFPRQNMLAVPASEGQPRALLWGGRRSFSSFAAPPGYHSGVTAAAADGPARP